jgi:hypothetical protein
VHRSECVRAWQRPCAAAAGVVVALLGGRVTATDLRPNLPLLRTNCAVNGDCFRRPSCEACLSTAINITTHAPRTPAYIVVWQRARAAASRGCDTIAPSSIQTAADGHAGVAQGELAVRVLEHEWGTDAAALRPPFDVVIACGMAL